MSKTNVFNLTGTIETLEERELPNGEGKYKLLQVIPSYCKRKLTVFISPSYKSGDKNKVYDNLNNYAVGDFVKLTLSPFNNKLFLFGIEYLNPKGEI